MDEVKNRVNVIVQFLDEKTSTSQPITDIEFLCLQFRKILEFIALSSLSANREKYEELRNNFRTDWHAERILEKIEKINPNFYPHPTRQVIDEKTGSIVKIENVTDGYLTREEFSNVYNECSMFLHAYNPYSFQAENLNIFRDKFRKWKDMIVTLLNHHQIQLVNDPRQLWVIMQAKDDGKVHVSEMVRT